MLIEPRRAALIPGFAQAKHAALDHIEKNEKNKKQAYENIVWALLNSKAFLFNQ